MDIQRIFAHFVEVSRDLLTVVDEEGRLLYVSPASEEVFGLSPQDCLGRSAWDFIHPDDAAPTRAAFRSWLEAESEECFTYENRQVDGEGRERTLLWTVTRHPHPDGGPTVLTSTARDITDLRASEQALAQSRSHFASVLEGMLDPVITIDEHGIIQDANRSCQNAFGYAPRELVGQNLSLLLPEPYRSEHDGYLERYRRTGHTNILGRTREFPVRHREGHEITVELSVSRIEVQGEERPLFCGSFRDISERKRAELALRESEQRFHAIFEQAYEFIGLLRPDGTLLEVNATALELVGSAREDVLGKPFWDTPWWSDRERERLRAAIDEAASGTFVRYETTHMRRDGALVSVDFSVKPFRNDAGDIVLLLPEGRDITDIKIAQRRELALSKAFAQIGESASLLAHEIKNPITSVNAALRAVAHQLGADEQEILAELVERMQKLERLMRRTLSFARPLDIQLSWVSPKELLETVALANRARLRELEISLEWRCAPDLAPIQADVSLLEELLTNLIVNASEALRGKGSIRITAEDRGEELRIAVEDSGPGIAPDLLSTLFKPFVSDKEQGTGIGLALVRKIVEAHGGTIQASNRPEGGARFEVRLPRCQ